MELSFNRLAEITRGADHVYTDPATGRFVMRRCTDAASAAYGRTGYDNKCRASAGIRFDFWTDSQTVSFDYTVTGRLSVVWMSIDLYADGVMVASDYRDTHLSCDEYTFSHRFERYARRRVTVYLPYMLDVQVRRFVLDDGAAVEPYADYRGRMLCFGDSITHGYHAKYSSCTYPAVVARYFDLDFNNQGNAGYIFDGETIDPAMDFHPDVITVAYGTNDWSKQKSREAFTAGADGFFRRLREVYPDTPVAAILPLWRGDSWRSKPTGNFDEACALLAGIMETYGCTVVDGAAAVPHLPQFYGDFRLHPNDLGFAFYALALIRVIGGMLG